MKTVKQVSALTGVSVRTLHHYDAIGLLRPTTVTAAGYRLYDDAALSRLQSILLFRQLRFSLAEIKEIMDAPQFDPTDALIRQITLLELERDRLDRILSFAREWKEKGVIPMTNQAFDRSEIERYKKQAKEQWGDTAAYREYVQRGEDPERDDGMMAYFAALGRLKHLSPEDKTVQREVDGLRSYICEHYYTCTVEIFGCLGEMYVSDGRFMRNIDAVGGEGTAAFAAKAIAVYCGR